MGWFYPGIRLARSNRCLDDRLVVRGRVFG